VQKTNCFDGKTSYVESFTGGQRIRMATYPNGGTRIEAYNQDGLDGECNWNGGFAGAI